MNHDTSLRRGSNVLGPRPHPAATTATGEPRWLQPALALLAALLIVLVAVGVFAVVNSLAGLADSLDRDPPRRQGIIALAER